MKKSPASVPHRSAATGSFVVRNLRTGKIYAEQASASEIQKSVGVRPSEVKVAEKALRVVIPRSEEKVKVAIRKPVSASPKSRATSRSAKSR